MIIPKYIIDKKKTKKEWKDYFTSELTIHSINNQIYNSKDEALSHRKVFTQLKKEKSTQLSITAVNIKKFDNISTQNEIALNFQNTKKILLNISQFNFEITHPKPCSKPNHKSIKHKLYENIYKNYNDKTIQDIDLTNYKALSYKVQHSLHSFPITKHHSKEPSMSSSYTQNSNYDEVHAIIQEHNKDLSSREPKRTKKYLTVDSFSDIYKQSSYTDRSSKPERSELLQSEVPFHLFKKSTLCRNMYRHVHFGNKKGSNINSNY